MILIFDNAVDAGYNDDVVLSDNVDDAVDVYACV